MAVTVVKLMATVSAVKITATVTLEFLMKVTATVGKPWGGYAYDYFAEDYTVTT